MYNFKMGQDAFTDFGITTTIRLTWKNLPVIRKIFELERSDLVQVYLWAGGVSCIDEVMRYSYEYDDDEHWLPWKVAFASQTEEAFNLHYSQLNLNGQASDKGEISVICPVLHADARNISRRALPEIFGQHATHRPIQEEIDSLSHDFHQAVERLCECGIPESSIKMGWIYSLDP